MNRTPFVTLCEEMPLSQSCLSSYFDRKKKKKKKITVVAKVWSSKVMILNKEWKWVTLHSKSSQLPICGPRPYIRSQILSFTLRRAIEVRKLRFRDFELDEAHSSNRMDKLGFESIWDWLQSSWFFYQNKLFLMVP